MILELCMLVPFLTMTTDNVSLTRNCGVLGWFTYCNYIGWTKYERWDFA